MASQRRRDWHRPDAGLDRYNSLAASLDFIFCLSVA